MYNQISRFTCLIAVIALCLTPLAVQSAHGAPDFPSEKTVQDLAQAFVYSQASLDPEEHKRLESIYYFDSQEDRTRYRNGVIKTIIPLPPGGPRFLSPDGSLFPSDYELIIPEDVLVVPPPADLTDDAEPIALVFIHYRLDGNYNDPRLLRFVHTDRGWLIRFETYKPTPNESRHDGDIYMALQAEGLRVERARWANAAGDDLMAEVRRFMNKARYILAGNEYAFAHDIRVGITKGGRSFITKQRLAESKQLMAEIVTLSPQELRIKVLQDIDQRLARYAENERKLEQGREYVRQLDERRRLP